MAAIIAMLSAGVTALVKTIWPFKTIRIDEKAIKERLGNTVKHLVSRKEKVKWARIRRLLRLKSEPTIRPAVKRGEVKVYSGTWMLAIPAFHQVRRCRAKQQVVRWQEQPVELNGHLCYQVGMTLFYKVADAYKFLFDVDEAKAATNDDNRLALNNDALSSACQSHLDTLAATLTPAGVSDRAQLAESLRDSLRSDMAEWGIQDFRIQFYCFKPDNEASELLMAEARVEKVNALMRDGWSRAEALAAVGCQVILNASSDQASHVSSDETNGSHTNGNGRGHFESVA